MKKFISLLQISLVLSLTTPFITNARDLTWTGATSGNWNDSANFSPMFVPTANDTVTIDAATHHPRLTNNASAYRLVLLDDTFDLNGYQLNIANEALFSGGWLVDGQLNCRGTIATFAGTVINAAVDVDCTTLQLNGSVFNQSCNFKAETGDSQGGNTFMAPVSLVHVGTAGESITMTMDQGDTFHDTLYVTNSSDGNIHLTQADTSHFKNCVRISSTGDGSIHFGREGGISILETNGHLVVENGEFTAGQLFIKNIEQQNATGHRMVLTGTGSSDEHSLLALESCHFTGDVDFTSPNLLLSINRFEGTALFTKTGGYDNVSKGDNLFSGDASFTNSSTTGHLLLTGSREDRFLASAEFTSGSTKIIAGYGATAIFEGDVVVNSATVGFYRLKFTGEAEQTLSGTVRHRYSEAELDKKSGLITTAIPVEIDRRMTFTKGYLVTDSVNLITFLAGTNATGASDASFVSGPVKKVGNTAFEFPVGKDGHFRPVGISAPDSVTDAFVGEYFDVPQQIGTQTDSTINHISNCNYWNLIQAEGNNSCDITFSYASNNCEIVLELPIHVANWQNSKWNDLGISPLVGDEYQIDSISNFGLFLAANFLKNGQSCEMPITLSVDSIYNASDHLFESFTEWYYFSPDSAENLLTINNQFDSTSTYSILKNIELYTGAFCDSLIIVQTWDFDTIAGTAPFSEVINLIPENNYYLKLTRYNHHDVCRQCSADSFLVNVFIQHLKYNGLSSFPICANLITNPGFNTPVGACGPFSCSNTSANNIINGCCPGWHSGWGSPQAAGNLGSQYLSMWCMNGNPPIGEGAYQNLSTPIYKNRTYILSYDYKYATTPAQMLRIYLRASGSPGVPISNPSCGGGDNLPWSVQSFPGVQLDAITTGLPLNWTYRSRCFNYSSLGGNINSLDQIVLYPEHYQAGTGWVDIDNFSVQELKYDFPNQTLCYNESITISPFCSISGVVYSWDVNDPGLSCYNCESPTLTNTNNTGAIQTINYTVTLNFTPSFGPSCSETFDISIAFLPQPDLSFSTTETCVGNSICFNFIPCSGQSAVWNFGDGTILNQTTSAICHQYSTPGEYLVTLTVNGTGTNTYTTNGYIQIYPNCCAFGYPFSHNDITVNPTSSTETWNSSSPYVSVNGTITVKTGKTLEITGHYLKFGPKGKIVIEPGATLNVSGSTLTGIYFLDPPCVNMWHGIEVYGNPTVNHNFANQSLQGRLFISNGSVIKDAHNAIIVGKPSGAGFDLTYSGGIIDVQNTTFRNNGANIRFAPFKFSNGSKVIDCEFITPSNQGYKLWDIGYTTGSSYTYPNQYNPFYASANSAGRSAIGIKAWGMKGVLSRDNTFNDVEEGIISIDSRLKIYRNDFSDMLAGIRIANTTSAIQYGNLISENTFNDVLWQVTMQGGKGDFIGPQGGYTQNIFGDFNSSQNNNLFGVLTIGSSSFSIVDNDFKNLKWGFIGWNTLQYGGYVGYRNRGNIFTDCGTSIAGIFDNPALRVHCNQFYTPTLGTYSGNSWNLGPGLYADQGSYSPTDPKAPAGNLFDEPTAKDITSASTLNYYRHNTSNDPRVDIDPQQSTIEHFNPVGFNANNNSEEPCAPEWQNPGQRLLALDSLTIALDSLSAVLEEISEHLEEEDTNQLLYEIENNNSDSALMNILVNASPLSDLVLLELNSGTHVLPADSLKGLFILNASFSDDVFTAITLENTLIDSAGKAMIKCRHMQYLDNYSYASLSKQINSVRVQIMQTRNQLFQDYLAEDALMDAINLIRGSEEYHDKQVIFSYYLVEGMLDSASTLLSDLEENELVDPDWLYVQNLLLAIAIDSVTVFALDSAERAELTMLAEKTLGSQATANARAILKLLYNEEYWDDLESIGNSSRWMSQFLPPTLSFTPKAAFIKVRPNPANTYIEIEFNNLTGESDKSIFEIHNSVGQKIFDMNINPGIRNLKINTENIFEGVYFAKVYNSRLTINKKFLIMH